MISDLRHSDLPSTCHCIKNIEAVCEGVAVSSWTFREACIAYTHEQFASSGLQNSSSAAKRVLSKLILDNILRHPI